MPALPSASIEEHAASVGASIVSETVLHSRYLSVYDRRIRFAAEPGIRQETELDFDVVGHPQCNFRFSVAFPFHPSRDGFEAQVTLIREYCQGTNSMAYCFPTGGFHPATHTSLEDCAVAELSEEAYLKCSGPPVRLVAEDHPGFAEVKWCANRFIPFLFIDPQADPSPGHRDAEEITLQVLRVPVSELREIMVSGNMMLPSITTAFLALRHLEQHGHLSMA